MSFKKLFTESKLDKVLNKILSKYEDLNEDICIGKIKSAIAEFIEIKEFKPIIDHRKQGITINGEFRGGENGSKHIELNCPSKKLNLEDIISDLNKNLKQINDSL